MNVNAVSVVGTVSATGGKRDCFEVDDAPLQVILGLG